MRRTAAVRAALVPARRRVVVLRAAATAGARLLRPRRDWVHPGRAVVLLPTAPALLSLTAGPTSAPGLALAGGAGAGAIVLLVAAVRRDEQLARPQPWAAGHQGCAATERTGDPNAVAASGPARTLLRHPVRR